MVLNPKYPTIEHEQAAETVVRFFAASSVAEAVLDKKRASKIKSLKPVHDLSVSTWIGNIDLTQFIEFTQHLIHRKGVFRWCIFDMLKYDIAFCINDDNAAVCDADLFKCHPKLFRYLKIHVR